jgi:hypothetical protein
MRLRMVAFKQCYVAPWCYALVDMMQFNEARMRGELQLVAFTTLLYAIVIAMIGAFVPQLSL